MPLALGDVSTERSQAILFDPAVAAEVKDAELRRKLLLRQGFLLKEEEPGRIVLEPPPRGAHLGVFRILSDNGDDRIVWDRRDPSQVREAFKKFRDFLARGYSAFVALASGKPGHRIDDFDPGLEEIILAAVGAGGEILMVPPTVPG